MVQVPSRPGSRWGGKSKRALPATRLLGWLVTMLLTAGFVLALMQFRVSSLVPPGGSEVAPQPSRSQLAPGQPQKRLDGLILKTVLPMPTQGPNLLQAFNWQPYGQGFQKQGDIWICHNSHDTSEQRGLYQHVILNQSRPEPIVAMAASKAEAVHGPVEGNYALYVDLRYQDGTPLYGQQAPFQAGTHDWQERRVLILPEKPVHSLTMYLLFRNCRGKVYFKEPRLVVVPIKGTLCLFEGATVRLVDRPHEGFQVRDVAAGSNFVRIEREALGIRLECRQTDGPEGVRFFDVQLQDTTGKDRAISLIYALRIPRQSDSSSPGTGSSVQSVSVSSAPKKKPGASDAKAAEAVWGKPSSSETISGASSDKEDLFWLVDPRREEPIRPGREYLNASRWNCGATGYLSRYPFGAVRRGKQGWGIGIDMMEPAFFRVGYHGTTEELYLAYDLGLTPEKPSAKVRFCTFSFDASWGFRSALARYYEIFPRAFQCRTPQQGLWMPFAKISEVQGWEDFGFKFKEGDNEPDWDDAHGIITFRYTEPMTWWMPMPKQMPRTMEAALAEAKRLADIGNPHAKALFTSGFHNAEGQFPARLLNTPWCDGAVWSMNSIPSLPGEPTDFSLKWNAKIRKLLYWPNRKEGLDGEYIDSSEGYVTDVLNFRREHFRFAERPLSFCQHTHRPAMFRGLIVFEYVRAIAKDIHAMGKLMMANGTPTQLCWLCPMLEVMGTETDWHIQGQWQPMSDSELLYRRALCKGKPYCFLMNTNFDQFGPELVEKYMKRCLAYGMFPGFFSPDASTGHYFTRPELYNRDRHLFKKYIPLCRRVAEAGWEPIPLAHSDNPKVYVERFGRRYLTVFNDSPQPQTATIRLEGLQPTRPETPELVHSGKIVWKEGQTTLSLGPEDVALLDLQPE
ncbi:MAG: hypothetical protein NZ602_07680 [Thermoguttaceae bacterium]|nr:hypothetical protein [Thermoguttaceae bacterium]MDW8037514.1 hypothetical protein [Thermoguttaceae bacterium]